MEIHKTGASKVSVDSALKQQYPCRMQLYKDPPAAQITLHEFEQYAIERLKGNHLILINLKCYMKVS